MADISVQDALVLAESLTTIGHPKYPPGALMATAMDIQGWCKGGIFDGRPWTPLEQAAAIVEEARTTWEGGWPDKGGTMRLFCLFRAKFDRAKLGAERQSIDVKKQQEHWEQKYGPPDPAFASSLLRVATKAEHAASRKAMLWQAVRDCLYYESPRGRADLAQIEDKNERINAYKHWREAAVRIRRDHPAEVAGFCVELEQYGWDALMRFDWMKTQAQPDLPARSNRVVTIPPATVADIEAIKAQQERDRKERP
jgi:hypothetical protein